jgi:hypothetical protein
MSGLRQWLPPGTSGYQARTVRNTITVNSAIATTTISDPTIGAATKASPFKQHDGNAGRKQDSADHVEPASIPTSRSTTLTHIISDPIIRLSWFAFVGCKRFGRAGAHALSPSL